jgi:hypothetical protein
MINRGATHVGVATDHVIESFRNDLWHGYKTSAGVEPDLLAQFPLLEDALRALGVVVWPMVEFEPTMPWRRRREGGRGSRGDARVRLHARQGLGAVGARASLSCSSIGARTRSRGRRRRKRSSASAPRRFPTTSRSSGTPPTAIRD